MENNCIIIRNIKNDLLEIDVNYILEVPKYKYVYLNNKNEAVLLNTYRQLNKNKRKTLIKLSKN
jgi:hypothetical protein